MGASEAQEIQLTFCARLCLLKEIRRVSAGSLQHLIEREVAQELASLSRSAWEFGYARNSAGPVFGK